MQRVDLYQSQFRPTRDPTDAMHMLAWVGIAAVLLVAASGALAWRAQAAEQELRAAEADRSSAQQRLSSLRGELEQLQAKREPDDAALRRLRAELEAKRRLLDVLESGDLIAGGGFAGYFGGLSRRIVDGVWLTRVRIDEGGARLRLEGHARRPEQVPALIGALGESEAYRGRRFRQLALERPESEQREAPMTFVLASEPLADPDGSEGSRR